MKSLYALSAGIALLALGACSTSQIQTAAGNVAAINGAAAGALQTVATSIIAACPAGEAFASAAAAATANPGVQIAAGANGMFCAINKAIVATAPAASAPAAASTPLAGAPLK
ncbi:hypothetical protein PQR71_42325 [Paraburkholderia fungorum]|uniref:hypothetical protein n=1 Tax=Paraburkholderia fungorum TaxID=134537 RepID=UPI0038BC53C5